MAAEDVHAVSVSRHVIESERKPIAAEFGRRGRETRLTNRTSERNALDRLIETIRLGQSQALVVRGDPGVGSTPGTTVFIIDFADHPRPSPTSRSSTPPPRTSSTRSR